MLGSAVSSKTPRDFQPSSHMGVRGSRPAMNLHAPVGSVMGCPYVAVGMHSASDSAMGLPSMPTSASLMLGFVMPADVSSNFMMPSASAAGDEPTVVGVRDV